MTRNYTLTYSRDMVRDGGIRRRWTHRLPWSRPSSGWIVADAYGQVIGATPFLGLLRTDDGATTVAQAWAAALIGIDGHDYSHVVAWTEEHPPQWVGERWRGSVVVLEQPAEGPYDEHAGSEGRA